MKHLKMKIGGTTEESQRPFVKNGTLGHTMTATIGYGNTAITKYARLEWLVLKTSALAQKRRIKLKKIMGIALTLLTVGILCAAKRWDPKLVNEFKNAKGTPEDSVVFYGGFSSMDPKAIISFTQTNPEFPADKQTMTGDYFISKPVPLGSCYILQHLEGIENKTTYVGNPNPVKGFDRKVTTESYKKHYSSKNTPLTIKVPDKPGIYYFGYYSARRTTEYEELIEATPGVLGPQTTDDWEEAVLKKVIPLYKDTDWEIKLQERLDTLLEAKQKQKKGDL